MPRPKRPHSLKLIMILALAGGALAPAGVAGAQTLDAKSALLVRDAFLADMDTVHAKIVALARAIPEDKYDWRPTPEVRSVANALIHVSLEWYFGLPASVGGTFPSEWPSYFEARSKLFALTAKKDVVEQLEKAWSHGSGQVAAATETQLFAAQLPIVTPPLSFPRSILYLGGDLHEHLGQLITYARSIGVKPPWSK